MKIYDKDPIDFTLPGKEMKALRKNLLALKIGQTLFVSKKEWKGKTSPQNRYSADLSYLKVFIEKKILTRKTPDGWYFKRIK